MPRRGEPLSGFSHTPAGESSLLLPYRAVRVHFKPGLWARISPSFSDSEVVKESIYDWTAVSGRYLPGESVKDWLQRFRETWLQTGICPDPGMYEVESSPWLQEVSAENGRRPGLKHFLITGHDAFIEVLAEEWSWTTERVLEGW